MVPGDPYLQNAYRLDSDQAIIDRPFVYIISERREEFGDDIPKTSGHVEVEFPLF